MKKDMDLARRIRGDQNLDRRDLVPKTGKEIFYQLDMRESRMTNQQNLNSQLNPGAGKKSTEKGATPNRKNK